MRIISPFHDYYDSAQALGQDRSLVWNRVSKEEYADKWPFPKFPFAAHRKPWERYPGVRLNLSQKAWIVGFCGKIYPVVVLSDENWDRPHAERKKKFCFSEAEFEEFVSLALGKDVVESYRANERQLNLMGRRARWPGRGGKKEVTKFFMECERRKKSYESMFVDSGCPCFTMEENREYHEQKHKITWNDKLSPLLFYRIFGVYQAYQELSMYYGGVLSHPNRPIPHVSDEDLAQAKGFDKWSFRQEPTRRR